MQGQHERALEQLFHNWQLQTVLPGCTTVVAMDACCQYVSF
jgi:hypothetical protein